MHASRIANAAVRPAVIRNAMTVPIVRQHITTRPRVTIEERPFFCRGAALYLPKRRSPKALVRAVSPKCSAADQLQYQVFVLSQGKNALLYLFPPTYQPI